MSAGPYVTHEELISMLGRDEWLQLVTKERTFRLMALPDPTRIGPALRRQIPPLPRLPQTGQRARPYRPWRPAARAHEGND